MLRKFFSSVFLLILLISIAVMGQLTKNDMDKSIDKAALKHPYLYFSEKDKPEMLNRIKTDPDCGYAIKEMSARANLAMRMPVSKNIPIQGKNTRGGWSKEDREGEYGKYYRVNLHNAFLLSFMYQITGDEKYAAKAFEFADAFCDLPTWTQRAHEFPVIYSRVMPWNVSDDQVNFSFDHFNGDAGRVMAAVYDWLYPALSIPQRDRIRGALLEKVITKVRGNYEYHWWAAAYRCNWCGVCNSGVGLAGLALLTEDPQLTDVAAESYNRINNMLNEIGEDGDWQEGGGYWSYGVSTSIFFADALKRISGGKYNLFNNAKLKNNPVTFAAYITLEPDKTLNFEDAEGKQIGSSSFFNKLAAETGSKTAVWYKNNYINCGNEPFDIIWPKPDIAPEAPSNPSFHFRTTGWWIMRDEFLNTEKVVVAGKAGMNTDPHHGHLDIGQFVIYWRNEYYISELGRMFYDEQYFDQARWDYPFASSAGHNVIFVNGEGQIPGKLRKQPWNYNIGGKVLDFKTSENRDFVLMDPSNAYPKKELKSWRRQIVFDKPEITVVLDEVKSARGAEIEARFHSECEMIVKDNFTLLKGKKGMMALIPVAENGFSFRPGKHAIQPVNAQVEFTWSPYLGTIVKAGNENTVLATIILPVENEAEANGIAGSVTRETDKAGNVIISFVKAGIKHLFKYNYTNNGLLLQQD
jgi:hypothetical protein